MSIVLLGVSLAVYFIIRYIAYYISFRKTGWLLVDHTGLAAVSFVSLVLGVITPAGAFDFVGILIRFLIVSVFISVIFDEDLSTAFGMALLAGVIEVILGLGLVLVFPTLGTVMSPFAVP